jgi:hypothetical protein
MATYELNRVSQQLEAVTSQLDRIEEQNSRILAFLTRGEMTSSDAEVLTPSFPAANQPETHNAFDSEARINEPTGAPNESPLGTGNETAGNTETVGQQQIGAGKPE